MLHFKSKLIIGVLFLMMVTSVVGWSQDTMHRPVPTGAYYTYLPWVSKEKEAKECGEVIVCENYLDTLEHLGCQHDCHVDGFYPIGWSKAGAFAYVHYQDDGEGLTDYVIKVIDSPKRKMKNKTYATSVTMIEEYNNIRHLWNTEAVYLQAFLDDNQIQSNTGKFHPIAFAKDKLKLIQKRNGQDGAVSAYKLVLQMGSNEVSLYEYTNQARNWNLDQVKIVGWYSSPYTSKVVFVLSYMEISPRKNRNHTFKLVTANWEP